MSILTVDKLNKKYPGFALQDISFSLTERAITGFIGRNGAGKTTTLKSLLNFVHPDSGRIAFFGQDFAEHELAIKEQIGFVSGGIDFYPRQKIAVITQATKQFYPHWDEAAYQHLSLIHILSLVPAPEPASSPLFPHILPLTTEYLKLSHSPFFFYILFPSLFLPASGITMYLSVYPVS